jgi:hypothetical protein
MSQNQLGRYNKYIQIATKNFLTDEEYDYNVEFIGKTLYSGTRMPLTMYCYTLDIECFLRSAYAGYASWRLDVKAKFELTNLGKLKYKLLEEMDLLEERTTCGTFALYGLRRNERKRQEQKIEKYKDHLNWKETREYYLEKREQSVEIYIGGLRIGIKYLDEVIKDKNAAEIILGNVMKFVIEGGKQEISMIAKIRYTYDQGIKETEWTQAAKDFRLFLLMIIDNFYSLLRLNPEFMLVAIRNRPLDILKMTMDTISGYLDRSRQAMGEPPYSGGWMFLYAVKKIILTYILNEFEKLYKVKFYDPIRYDDFYWRFTHLVDGLYLFGDNGMLVKNKQIIATWDLSISDIYAGYLRRDAEGRNFCFFPRISAGIDSGSTGGMLTTVWNIENQVNMWSCFNEGKLTIDNEEWPEIAGLCESTKAFLGHMYVERMKRWMSQGVRLTTDSTDKSIPFRIKRGRVNNFSLSHKKMPLANEFAQLVIASGLSSLKIQKFYEWVKKKKLKIPEYVYGIRERIGSVLRSNELVEDFMNLQKRKTLEVLAAPLELNFNI